MLTTGALCATRRGGQQAVASLRRALWVLGAGAGIALVLWVTFSVLSGGYANAAPATLASPVNSSPAKSARAPEGGVAAKPGKKSTKKAPKKAPQKAPQKAPKKSAAAKKPAAPKPRTKKQTKTTVQTRPVLLTKPGKTLTGSDSPYVLSPATVRQRAKEKGYTKRDPKTGKPVADTNAYIKAYNKTSAKASTKTSTSAATKTATKAGTRSRPVKNDRDGDGKTDAQRGATGSYDPAKKRGTAKVSNGKGRTEQKSCKGAACDKFTVGLESGEKVGFVRKGGTYVIDSRVPTKDLSQRELERITGTVTRDTLRKMRGPVGKPADQDQLDVERAAVRDAIRDAIEKAQRPDVATATARDKKATTTIEHRPGGVTREAHGDGGASIGLADGKNYRSGGGVNPDPDRYAKWEPNVGAVRVDTRDGWTDAQGKAFDGAKVSANLGKDKTGKPVYVEAQSPDKAKLIGEGTRNASLIANITAGPAPRYELHAYGGTVNGRDPEGRRFGVRKGHDNYGTAWSKDYDSVGAGRIREVSAGQADDYWVKRVDGTTIRGTEQREAHRKETPWLGGDGSVETSERTLGTVSLRANGDGRCVGGCEITTADRNYRIEFDGDGADPLDTKGGSRLTVRFPHGAPPVYWGTAKGEHARIDAEGPGIALPGGKQGSDALHATADDKVTFSHAFGTPDGSKRADGRRPYSTFTASGLKFTGTATGGENTATVTAKNGAGHKNVAGQDVPTEATLEMLTPYADGTNNGWSHHEGRGVTLDRGPATVDPFPFVAQNPATTYLLGQPYGRTPMTEQEKKDAGPNGLLRPLTEGELAERTEGMSRREADAFRAKYDASLPKLTQELAARAGAEFLGRQSERRDQQRELEQRLPDSLGTAEQVVKAGKELSPAEAAKIGVKPGDLATLTALYDKAQANSDVINAVRMAGRGRADLDGGDLRSAADKKFTEELVDRFDKGMTQTDRKLQAMDGKPLAAQQKATAQLFADQTGYFDTLDTLNGLREKQDAIDKRASANDKAVVAAKRDGVVTSAEANAVNSDWRRIVADQATLDKQADPLRARLAKQGDVVRGDDIRFARADGRTGYAGELVRADRAVDVLDAAQAVLRRSELTTPKQAEVAGAVGLGRQVAGWNYEAVRDGAKVEPTRLAGISSGFDDVINASTGAQKIAAYGSYDGPAADFLNPNRLKDLDGDKKAIAREYNDPDVLADFAAYQGTPGQAEKLVLPQNSAEFVTKYTGIANTQANQGRRAGAMRELMASEYDKAPYWDTMLSSLRKSEQDGWQQAKKDSRPGIVQHWVGGATEHATFDMDRAGSTGKYFKGAWNIVPTTLTGATSLVENTGYELRNRNWHDVRRLPGESRSSVDHARHPAWEGLKGTVRETGRRMFDYDKAKADYGRDPIGTGWHDVVGTVGIAAGGLGAAATVSSAGLRGAAAGARFAGSTSWAGRLRTASAAAADGATAMGRAVTPMMAPLRLPRYCAGACAAGLDHFGVLPRTAGALRQYRNVGLTGVAASAATGQYRNFGDGVSRGDDPAALRTQYRNEVRKQTDASARRIDELAGTDPARLLNWQQAARTTDPARVVRREQRALQRRLARTDQRYTRIARQLGHAPRGHVLTSAARYRVPGAASPRVFPGAGMRQADVLAGPRAPGETPAAAHRAAPEGPVVSNAVSDPARTGIEPPAGAEPVPPRARTGADVSTPRAEGPAPRGERTMPKFAAFGVKAAAATMLLATQLFPGAVADGLFSGKPATSITVVDGVRAAAKSEVQQAGTGAWAAKPRAADAATRGPANSGAPPRGTAEPVAVSARAVTEALLAEGPRDLANPVAATQNHVTTQRNTPLPRPVLSRQPLPVLPWREENNQYRRTTGLPGLRSSRLDRGTRRWLRATQRETARLNQLPVGELRTAAERYLHDARAADAEAARYRAYGDQARTGGWQAMFPQEPTRAGKEKLQQAANAAAAGATAAAEVARGWARVAGRVLTVKQLSPDAVLYDVLALRQDDLAARYDHVAATYTAAGASEQAADARAAAREARHAAAEFRAEGALTAASALDRLNRPHLAGELREKVSAAREVAATGTQPHPEPAPVPAPVPANGPDNGVKATDPRGERRSRRGAEEPGAPRTDTGDPIAELVWVVERLASEPLDWFATHRDAQRPVAGELGLFAFADAGELGDFLAGHGHVLPDETLTNAMAAIDVLRQEPGGAIAAGLVRGDGTSAPGTLGTVESGEDNVLRRMRDRMHARGPPAWNRWLIDNTGFGLLPWTSAGVILLLVAVLAAGGQPATIVLAAVSLVNFGLVAAGLAAQQNHTRLAKLILATVAVASALLALPALGLGAAQGGALAAAAGFGPIIGRDRADREAFVLSGRLLKLVRPYERPYERAGEGDDDSPFARVLRAVVDDTIALRKNVRDLPAGDGEPLREWFADAIQRLADQLAELDGLPHIELRERLARHHESQVRRLLAVSKAELDAAGTAARDLADEVAEAVRLRALQLQLWFWRLDPAHQTHELENAVKSIVDSAVEIQRVVRTLPASQSDPVRAAATGTLALVAEQLRKLVADFRVTTREGVADPLALRHRLDWHLDTQLAPLAGKLREEFDRVSQDQAVRKKADAAAFLLGNAVAALHKQYRGFEARHRDSWIERLIDEIVRLVRDDVLKPVLRLPVGTDVAELQALIEQLSVLTDRVVALGRDVAERRVRGAAHHEQLVGLQAALRVLAFPLRAGLPEPEPEQARHRKLIVRARLADLDRLLGDDQGSAGAESVLAVTAIGLTVAAIGYVAGFATVAPVLTAGLGLVLLGAAVVRGLRAKGRRGRLAAAGMAIAGVLLIGFASEGHTNPEHLLAGAMAVPPGGKRSPKRQVSPELAAAEADIARAKVLTPALVAGWLREFFLAGRAEYLPLDELVGVLAAVRHAKRGEQTELRELVLHATSSGRYAGPSLLAKNAEAGVPFDVVLPYSRAVTELGLFRLPFEDGKRRLEVRFPAGGQDETVREVVLTAPRRDSAADQDGPPLRARLLDFRREMLRHSGVDLTLADTLRFYQLLLAAPRRDLGLVSGHPQYGVIVPADPLAERLGLAGQQWVISLRARLADHRLIAIQPADTNQRWRAAATQHGEAILGGFQPGDGAGSRAAAESALRAAYAAGAWTPLHRDDLPTGIQLPSRVWVVAVPRVAVPDEWVARRLGALVLSVKRKSVVFVIEENWDRLPVAAQRELLLEVIPFAQGTTERADQAGIDRLLDRLRAGDDGVLAIGPLAVAAVLGAGLSAGAATVLSVVMFGLAAAALAAGFVVPWLRRPAGPNAWRGVAPAFLLRVWLGGRPSWLDGGGPNAPPETAAGTRPRRLLEHLWHRRVPRWFGRELVRHGKAFERGGAGFVVTANGERMDRETHAAWLAGLWRQADLLAEEDWLAGWEHLYAEHDRVLRWTASATVFAQAVLALLGNATVWMFASDAVAGGPVRIGELTQLVIAAGAAALLWFAAARTLVVRSTMDVALDEPLAVGFRTGIRGGRLALIAPGGRYVRAARQPGERGRRGRHALLHAVEALRTMAVREGITTVDDTLFDTLAGILPGLATPAGARGRWQVFTADRSGDRIVLVFRGRELAGLLGRSVTHLDGAALVDAAVQAIGSRRKWWRHDDFGAILIGGFRDAAERRRVRRVTLAMLADGLATPIDEGGAGSPPAVTLPSDEFARRLVGRKVLDAERALEIVTNLVEFAVHTRRGDWMVLLDDRWAEFQRHLDEQAIPLTRQEFLELLRAHVNRFHLGRGRHSEDEHARDAAKTERLVITARRMAVFGLGNELAALFTARAVDLLPVTEVWPELSAPLRALIERVPGPRLANALVAFTARHPEWLLRTDEKTGVRYLVRVPAAVLGDEFAGVRVAVADGLVQLRFPAAAGKVLVVAGIWGGAVDSTPLANVLAAAEEFRAGLAGTPPPLSMDDVDIPAVLRFFAALAGQVAGAGVSRVRLDGGPATVSTTNLGDPDLVSLRDIVVRNLSFAAFADYSGGPASVAETARLEVIRDEAAAMVTALRAGKGTMRLHSMIDRFGGEKAFRTALVVEPRLIARGDWVGALPSDGLVPDQWLATGRGMVLRLETANGALLAGLPHLRQLAAELGIGLTTVVDLLTVGWAREGKTAAVEIGGKVRTGRLHAFRAAPAATAPALPWVLAAVRVAGEASGWMLAGLRQEAPAEDVTDAANWGELLVRVVREKSGHVSNLDELKAGFPSIADRLGELIAGEPRLIPLLADNLVGAVPADELDPTPWRTTALGLEWHLTSAKFGLLTANVRDLDELATRGRLTLAQLVALLTTAWTGTHDPEPSVWTGPGPAGPSLRFTVQGPRRGGTDGTARWLVQTVTPMVSSLRRSLLASVEPLGEAEPGAVSGTPLTARQRALLAEVFGAAPQAAPMWRALGFLLWLFTRGPRVLVRADESVRRSLRWRGEPRLLDDLVEFVGNDADGHAVLYLTDARLKAFLVSRLLGRLPRGYWREVVRHVETFHLHREETIRLPRTGQRIGHDQHAAQLFAAWRVANQRHTAAFGPVHAAGFTMLLWTGMVFAQPALVNDLAWPGAVLLPLLLLGPLGYKVGARFSTTSVFQLGAIGTGLIAAGGLAGKLRLAMNGVDTLGGPVPWQAELGAGVVVSALVTLWFGIRRAALADALRDPLAAGFHVAFRNARLALRLRVPRGERSVEVRTFRLPEERGRRTRHPLWHALGALEAQAAREGITTREDGPRSAFDVLARAWPHRGRPVFADRHHQLHVLRHDGITLVFVLHGNEIVAMLSGSVRGLHGDALIAAAFAAAGIEPGTPRGGSLADLPDDGYELRGAAKGRMDRYVGGVDSEDTLPTVDGRPLVRLSRRAAVAEAGEDVEPVIAYTWQDRWGWQIGMYEEVYDEITELILRKLLPPDFIDRIVTFERVYRIDRGNGDWRIASARDLVGELNDAKAEAAVPEALTAVLLRLSFQENRPIEGIAVDELATQPEIADLLPAVGPLVPVLEGLAARSPEFVLVADESARMAVALIPEAAGTMLRGDYGEFLGITLVRGTVRLSFATPDGRTVTFSGARRDESIGAALDRVYATMAAWAERIGESLDPESPRGAALNAMLRAARQLGPGPDFADGTTATYLLPLSDVLDQSVGYGDLRLRAEDTGPVIDLVEITVAGDDGHEAEDLTSPLVAAARKHSAVLAAWLRATPGRTMPESRAFEPLNLLFEDELGDLPDDLRESLIERMLSAMVAGHRRVIRRNGLLGYLPLNGLNPAEWTPTEHGMRWDAKVGDRTWTVYQRDFARLGRQQRLGDGEVFALVRMAAAQSSTPASILWMDDAPYAPVIAYRFTRFDREGQSNELWAVTLAPHDGDWIVDGLFPAGPALTGAGHGPLTVLDPSGWTNVGGQWQLRLLRPAGEVLVSTWERVQEIALRLGSHPRHVVALLAEGWASEGTAAEPVPGSDAEPETREHRFAGPENPVSDAPRRWLLTVTALGDGNWEPRELAEDAGSQLISDIERFLAGDHGEDGAATKDGSRLTTEQNRAAAVAFPGADNAPLSLRFAGFLVWLFGALALWIGGNGPRAPPWRVRTHDSMVRTADPALIERILEFVVRDGARDRSYQYLTDRTLRELIGHLLHRRLPLSFVRELVRHAAFHVPGGPEAGHGRHNHGLADAWAAARAPKPVRRKAWRVALAMVLVAGAFGASVDGAAVRQAAVPRQTPARRTHARTAGDREPELDLPIAQQWEVLAGLLTHASAELEGMDPVLAAAHENRVRADDARLIFRELVLLLPEDVRPGWHQVRFDFADHPGEPLTVNLLVEQRGNGQLFIGDLRPVVDGADMPSLLDVARRTQPGAAAALANTVIDRLHLDYTAARIKSLLADAPARMLTVREIQRWLRSSHSRRDRSLGGYSPKQFAALVGRVADDPASGLTVTDAGGARVVMPRPDGHRALAVLPLAAGAVFAPGPLVTAAVLVVGGLVAVTGVAALLDARRIGYRIRWPGRAEAWVRREQQRLTSPEELAFLARVETLLAMQTPPIRRHGVGASRPWRLGPAHAPVAMYKSVTPPRWARWLIKAGPMRELAALRAVREVFAWHDLVPLAVPVNGSDGPGIAVAWQPHTSSAWKFKAPRGFADFDKQRIAILRDVFGDIDGHRGNLLVRNTVRDELKRHRLLAIDFEYAFTHYLLGPRLRWSPHGIAVAQDLQAEVIGKPFTEEVRTSLSTVDPKALVAFLAGAAPRWRIRRAAARLRLFQRAGMMPGGRARPARNGVRGDALAAVPVLASPGSVASVSGHPLLLGFAWIAVVFLFFVLRAVFRARRAGRAEATPRRWHREDETWVAYPGNLAGLAEQIGGTVADVEALLSIASARETGRTPARSGDAPAVRVSFTDPTGAGAIRDWVLTLIEVAPHTLRPVRLTLAPGEQARSQAGAGLDAVFAYATRRELTRRIAELLGSTETGTRTRSDLLAVLAPYGGAPELIDRLVDGDPERLVRDGEWVGLRPRGSGDLPLWPTESGLEWRLDGENDQLRVGWPRLRELADRHRLSLGHAMALVEFGWDEVVWNVLPSAGDRPRLAYPFADLLTDEPWELVLERDSDGWRLAGLVLAGTGEHRRWRVRNERGEELSAGADALTLLARRLGIGTAELEALLTQAWLAKDEPFEESPSGDLSYRFTATRPVGPDATTRWTLNVVGHTQDHWQVDRLEPDRPEDADKAGAGRPREQEDAATLAARVVRWLREGAGTVSPFGLAVTFPDLAGRVEELVAADRNLRWDESRELIGVLPYDGADPEVWRPTPQGMALVLAGDRGEAVLIRWTDIRDRFLFEANGDFAVLHGLLWDGINDRAATETIIRWGPDDSPALEIRFTASDPKVGGRWRVVLVEESVDVAWMVEFGKVAAEATRARLDTLVARLRRHGPRETTRIEEDYPDLDGLVVLDPRLRVRDGWVGATPLEELEPVHWAPAPRGMVWEIQPHADGTPPWQAFWGNIVGIAEEIGAGPATVVALLELAAKTARVGTPVRWGEFAALAFRFQEPQPRTRAVRHWELTVVLRGPAAETHRVARLRVVPDPDTAPVPSDAGGVFTERHDGGPTTTAIAGVLSGLADATAGLLRVAPGHRMTKRDLYVKLGLRGGFLADGTPVTEALLDRVAEFGAPRLRVDGDSLVLRPDSAR